jgi:hypothetical protein
MPSWPYNSTTNGRTSLKLSPFDSAYTITPLYFLSAYLVDFCLKLHALTHGVFVVLLVATSNISARLFDVHDGPRACAHSSSSVCCCQSAVAVACVSDVHRRSTSFTAVERTQAQTRRSTTGGRSRRATKRTEDRRRNHNTRESTNEYEYGEDRRSRVYCARVVARPIADRTTRACVAALVPRQSASAHATPAGDCTFCCEDFTHENYVEYQSVEGGPWMKSQYCRECIEEHFIGKQVRTRTHTGDRHARGRHWTR